MRERLMIPGPTPVPPVVLAAMGKSMISHRGAEFEQLYRHLQTQLKQVFRTRQEVLVFPAAGTGAMEAVLVNLFSPGDRILACETGEFGTRFAAMARSFHLEVEAMTSPVGSGLNVEAVTQRIAARNTEPLKGVLVTHSETSTGVCNPLQKLGQACRSQDTLLVVDGVSSLGGLPLEMDDWGLDAVVTASQKALMTPPGLAFAALSEKAWHTTLTAKLPRSYWDLNAAMAASQKGQTPYTPALSLLFALEQALDMILEEGLESCWQRHRAYGRGMRAGLQALGLQIVAQKPYCSDTVTAVWIPKVLGADRIRMQMNDEFGIVVANGQGVFAGRMIRIGHMGYVSAEDILATLAALEACLTGKMKEDSSAASVASKVILEERVKK